MTLCSKSMKSDAPKEKGKKAPRVWELGGCANKEVLDYSAPTTNGTPEAALSEDINLVRGSWGQSEGPLRRDQEGDSGIHLSKGGNPMWSFHIPSGHGKLRAFCPQSFVF